MGTIEYGFSLKTNMGIEPYGTRVTGGYKSNNHIDLTHVEWVVEYSPQNIPSEPTLFPSYVHHYTSAVVVVVPDDAQKLPPKYRPDATNVLGRG